MTREGHARTWMYTFGQPAFIRFSIIVSDYHTVIDYQFSAAVSVPVCPLLSVCFKLSTAGRRAEHFQRERVLPDPFAVVRGRPSQEKLLRSFYSPKL